MKSNMISLAFVGQAVAIPAIRGVFAPNDVEMVRRGAGYEVEAYPTPSEYHSSPIYPIGTGGGDGPSPTEPSTTDGPGPNPTSYPDQEVSTTSCATSTKTGDVPYETTVTETYSTSVIKTATSFVPISSPVGQEGTKTFYSTYLSIVYSTYYAEETSSSVNVIYPAHPTPVVTEPVGANEPAYPTPVVTEPVGVNEPAHPVPAVTEPADEQCAPAVTVYVSVYPDSTIYSTEHPAPTAPAAGEGAPAPGNNEGSEYPSTPSNPQPGQGEGEGPQEGSYPHKPEESEDNNGNNGDSYPSKPSPEHPGSDNDYPSQPEPETPGNSGDSDYPSQSEPETPGNGGDDYPSQPEPTPCTTSKGSQGTTAPPQPTGTTGSPYGYPIAPKKAWNALF